jgi:putative ABC transport system ATP-binding protein
MEAVARLAYVLPRTDRASAADGLGQLSHRFFEVFSLHKSVTSLLLGGIEAALATLVGLLVLAFYHPMLLAFDILLVAALAAIIFGLGRGGVATAIAESSAKYRLASFLTEVERATLSFRDRAGEHYARAEIDHLCAGYLGARSTHYRVVLRQLIGALGTQALASAALLGLGGYLVVRRELTLGQLVAAELIVTAVIAALGDLGKHLETYYDLVASLYKLDQVLELPLEEDDDEREADSRPAGPASLVLREVWMRVGDRPLFEGASIQLSPGSRTQLVGPAESGKSSLMQLLYGLRRAESGAVLLDGVDTREKSQAALRDRVAIVHGPEVVPGSVIDNVRLSRRDIKSGQIRALLDQLGLLPELSGLPQGLDTELGREGVRLSHSQALRLTLARALARSPGLLALDADLHCLSASSLEQVMSVVARDDAPWTLLMVGDSAQLGRWCTQVARIERRQIRLEPSAGPAARGEPS